MLRRALDLNQIEAYAVNPCAICAYKKGSKMRDMRNIYRFTTTTHLRTNLSKKRVMLAYAENGVTCWDKRDARELRYLIQQIEVELAAREAQQKLFE